MTESRGLASARCGRGLRMKSGSGTHAFSAQKFKTRYATIGFSDKANLDEGAMRPTSFALSKLGASEEARIVAFVKKAVR